MLSRISRLYLRNPSLHLQSAYLFSSTSVFAEKLGKWNSLQSLHSNNNTFPTNSIHITIDGKSIESVENGSSVLSLPCF